MISRSVIAALMVIGLLFPMATSVFATSVTWDFFNDSLVSVANESAKQVESHIAVRGNNNSHLLSSYMEKTGTGEYKCRAATSTDAGVSWTDRGYLPLTPTDTATNDPAVTTDTNGNYFVVCLLNHATISYWVSTNGGSSWSGPNTVSTGTSNDKPWIATDLKDTTSSHRNKVYVCWVNESGDTMTLKFRKIWPSTGSTLNVATGSHTIGSNGPINDCAISVGKSGIIYVTWARLTGSSTGQVELRRSFDGGASFETGAGTNPQVVKTFTRAPTSVGNCSHQWGCIPGKVSTTGIRVSPMPTSAIDSNWNLHVVFMDYSSSTKTDIKYVKGTSCITQNSACSFSSAVNVLNDGGVARDQFQPTITVSAKSNTIHITALDRRNSSTNTLWQPWHYHCHLASTTCTSSAHWAVTSITTQSSTNDDGEFFVGDYSGITSSSSREAHATFPDDRLWGGNIDFNIWSNRLT
jgi:hypothetical protein